MLAFYIFNLLYFKGLYIANNFQLEESIPANKLYPSTEEYQKVVVMVE